MHSININLNPEIYRDTEYYFWCIFERQNEKLINCGHGWSKSIREAFEDAHQFYVEHYLSKQ